MTPMENALQAEIGFWQRLISERTESADSVTLARMKQALELAEFRLMELMNEPGDENRCH